MIKEIAEDGFEPFLLLMAEVECGTHFDAQNSEHTDWLRKLIGRRYGSGVRFYGMYEGDIPLGLAGVLTERSPHSDWAKCELMDIGIFPKYRGMGHGSKLLGLMEEKAREDRCYCMYMRTYAGSYKVIAFYGKNGYAPVATLPDDNGPGDEGTVFMRKVLGK